MRDLMAEVIGPLADALDPTDAMVRLGRKPPCACFNNEPTLIAIFADRRCQSGVTVALGRAA